MIVNDLDNRMSGRGRRAVNGRRVAEVSGRWGCKARKGLSRKRGSRGADLKRVGENVCRRAGKGIFKGRRAVRCVPRRRGAVRGGRGGSRGRRVDIAWSLG